MTRRNRRVAVSSCCAVLCAVAAFGQGGRGGGDWATSGSDAHRSGWVRTDTKISLAGMQKPGFAFLWKQKLASDTKQLNSLTEAVLMDRYIGYRGFRSLAHLGASGDRIIALDTDLGRIEWQKSIGTSGAQPGTMSCPGGLTAALARPVGTAFPAMGAGGRGGGGGRGGPAKSGVGEPGEGAVQLAALAAQQNQFANAGGAGGGRGARGNQPGAPGAPNAARGGGGGFQRMPSYVYGLSSDGKLHAMYVSNGEEPNPAVAFLPANANAVGLTVVNNVAYVATTGGCGSAGNGVWSMDLNTKQVNSWKASGNIAGTKGFAFGPDGTIYAATEGGDLVALEPKGLKALATYKAGGFASSPVVFEYKEKPMVAILATDGSIHVLPSTLENAAAKSPVPGEVATGGLATWQDADGSRYLLSAGTNAVTAWKLGEGSLEKAWTSREMVAPLSPMVVNGVVFAVSSGEYRGKDAATAQQRAQKSGKAVLYALDGKTGKELWSSGNTITSFAHSGGLSAGGSQMYVQTYDGTLWAFGFPIEH